MNHVSLSDTKINNGPQLAEAGRLSKYGLIAILIIFTILGLLYDVTVPFFEKPDELKHFAMIQFIQSRRQLPTVRAGVYKSWDQEGTQPPLYHILAAIAVSWLNLSDFEEPPRNPHYVDDRSFIWRERGNNNLYLHPTGEEWSTAPVFLAARLARWLSLLAGLGTVTLTYILGRIIFVDDTSAHSQAPNSKSDFQRITIVPWLPLLAAALVAFIPQFLHVSSAISNDGLAATFAAAALALLALIIKNGSSTRYALYLGLTLGLGAITKLSLLYLWPLTGLVFLLDFYRRRSIGHLLKCGAIIGSFILLMAGWWYWRNWQLYGDISALNAHLLYRGGALYPRPTLAQIWQTEMVGLELSFWAAFGAGQILLEPWLYGLLRWVKYIVLLGLAIGIWRSFRFQVSDLESQNTHRTTPDSSLAGQAFIIHPLQGKPSSFIILTLLALWTLTIFIALLSWMQITPASWGRLLYPALPALGILTAWGLSQIVDLVSGFGVWISGFGLRVLGFGFRMLSFTHHASLILPLLLVTPLFSLSLIAPFRYIKTAYAKTPLISETDIPTERVERLDFTYSDDALRLIGYTINKPSVHPGDWLPVTLYWQATQPIAKNYSAFAHLLDDKGNSIGQANTYPDGGKWPTSMLEPGGVLKDTYYVYVPSEAEAPMVTRLAIGIFEFEDPARAAKAAVNTAGEAIEPIVAGVPLLPHQWPELNPTYPLEATFGGQIKLVGYDSSPNLKIKPGAVVSLTLYWETLAPPGQTLNLFIHLIDPPTQTQVAGFDGPSRYPTAFWQSGNTIIDSRTLAFPADLPPGNYDLHIGWYNLDDFARLSLAGENILNDTLPLITVSVE